MQKPNARPKKRGREGTREEIIKAGKQKEFINGPKLPDRPPQKKKNRREKESRKSHSNARERYRKYQVNRNVTKYKGTCLIRGQIRGGLLKIIPAMLFYFGS